MFRELVENKERLLRSARIITNNRDKEMCERWRNRKNGVIDRWEISDVLLDIGFGSTDVAETVGQYRLLHLQKYKVGSGGEQNSS